ncbi:MAG: glycosyltransferase [Methylococcales bacterium]|nr:glycosyltransferase [Methylococcales bacterium]
MVIYNTASIMPRPSINVFIPTYNAELFIATLLTSIKSSPYNVYILVIDSSSSDDTVNIVRQYAAEIIVIPQSDFNHGATREFARKKYPHDITVFLTQDALPTSTDLIEKLVAPLIADKTIAVSYGRQIPQDNADIFEAFPREYNYGVEAQVRSIGDVNQFGVYTFFCSNSCAAYRNSALDEVGGFKRVLTNEDYFAVADLLQKGYKIAYVPDAVVIHSHRYTLWQEFQRYFDTGYVRAEYPIIQQLVGQAEKRGMGFVTALIKKLWIERPRLIPYAIGQSLIKWLGYRVGFYGKKLPLWLKKQLSQQHYYW